jgi:hypothetical protein
MATTVSPHRLPTAVPALTPTADILSNSYIDDNTPARSNSADDRHFDADLR